jgi:predicted permease
MNSASIVLNSFLSTIPVYLFFAVGFWLRQKQVIQQGHDAPIMQLAMDVAYPCLVFHSIMKYMVLSDNETLRSISFSLQAIGAGALELLLGITAAWLIAKSLRLRIGTGLRTFTLTAGVQNYAFFVIPIIQMLFSQGNDPTLGVLFVHNVGCELIIWSLGVMIIAGGAHNLRIGIFFRGPLLAVILGLTLAWTGLGSYVTHPPLMKTLEMIGNCATPLCLILFGCSMRDLWHNMTWKPKMISCGLLTRLVLAPALILLMAWLLPVDDYVKRIMVIQSAIPSAVIPVILAKRFGGNPDMGTQILLTTTVTSFLTLPVWLTLGSMFVVPLY